MRRARIAVLSLILGLTLCACTHDVDYSAYAGRFTLMSVESETLSYADFDYAVMTLEKTGGYALEYKHKGTAGTMTGSFAPDGELLRFTGDVDGTAAYEPGYFTLTFRWGDAQAVMLFAQS